jgi:hypothetical protein
MKASESIETLNTFYIFVSKALTEGVLALV